MQAFREHRDYSWRPARRLRHVTAVSLLNLYDPEAHGATAYHYDLRTWDSERSSWTSFYRSEKLPINHNLEWERQSLDPESEIALQGLQHLQNVGPLRLRVYAGAAQRAAASTPGRTAEPCVTDSSGCYGPGAAWAGAADPAGGSGPKPSDYEAQHLLHLRRAEPCHRPGGGRGLQQQGARAAGHPGTAAAPPSAAHCPAASAAAATSGGGGTGGGGGGGRRGDGLGGNQWGDEVQPLEPFRAHTAQRVQPGSKGSAPAPMQPPWEAGPTGVPSDPGEDPGAQPIGSRSRMAGGGAGAASGNVAGEEGGDLAGGCRGDRGGGPRGVPARAAGPGVLVVRDVVERVFARICQQQQQQQQQQQHQQYQQHLRQPQRQQQEQQGQQQQQQREHRQVQVQQAPEQGQRAEVVPGRGGHPAMQLDDLEPSCQRDAGPQHAEQGYQRARQRERAAGADTPGNDGPEAVPGSRPGPDKYVTPYDSSLSSGSSSTDCSGSGNSSNLRSTGGNTSDWSATTGTRPQGHEPTDTAAATPAETSDGGPDSGSGAAMGAVTSPSQACARRAGSGRGPEEQGPGGGCPPGKAVWGGPRDGASAGVELSDGTAQAWRPSTQPLQQLQQLPLELSPPAPPPPPQQGREQQPGEGSLEHQGEDAVAPSGSPWLGGAGVMRRSVAGGSVPRQAPRCESEVVDDGGAAAAWPDGGSCGGGGCAYADGYGGQVDVTAGGRGAAGGPGAEGGGGGEGGGNPHDCWVARLVAEFVFELSDLVPLEPHMLQRTWPINLPVLLMAPDRQPFTPRSALPPPSLPPSLPLTRTVGPAAGTGQGQAGTRAAASMPSRAVFLRGLQPGEVWNQWVGPVAGGNGAEGASGERPADDKRALLRWLLGSGSIVQPLQAADSLDGELQDEVILAATAAGGGAGGGPGGGGRHRSFSAVCVAAPAAASTSVLPPRHGQPRLSAADAAALLDPGPAPGFLPGALAVLFGQELPRASQSVVGASAAAAAGAAPVQAHFGGPASRAAFPPAPEESPYPGVTGAHAAATAAAAAAAAATGAAAVAAGGRRVASTPSLPAVGTTAGSRDLASGGSVAAWASTPDLVAASAAAADPGAAAGRDLSHSAAGSYDNLARAGSPGVCNHLSAPPSPSSSNLSCSLGPQQPLAAAAGGAAAPSALSRGSSQALLASLAAAAQPGASRASAASLPAPRPPYPPLTMPAVAAGTAGQNAGLTGTAVIPGWALALPPQFQPQSQPHPQLQLQPGPQVLLAAGAGAARDPSLAIPAVSDGTSPGLDAAPGGGLLAHQPHHHHHHQQHEPSLHPRPQQHPVLSAPHGLPEGHSHRRHGQRMCDVLEVRASIRRLTQLQERLHGARVRALGMRQQLAAAAFRRHQADERRARADTARAERDYWAHRAAQAGAQTEQLRAAAAERRRVLRERALAIAHAAGVLKGAEMRRLSAEEQLEGPSGRGHLAGLTAALVGRRNRLVAELGRIFQIGPVSEALLEPAPLDLTLDSSWAGAWAGDSFKQEPQQGDRRQQQQQQHPQQQQQQQQQQPGRGQLERQRSAGGAVGGPGGGRPAPASGPTRLAVVGLELPPDLIPRSLQGPTSWSPLDLGRTYDADQRTAASLGYLAEAVDLAAAYLGVPLRYPIAPRVSVSYISDPVPPSAGVRAGSAAVAPLPQASPAPPTGSAAGVHIALGGEWRLLSLATGAIGAAAAAAAAAATGGAAPATPPPAVGLIPGPRGVGSAGRLAVFSSLLNACLDPRVAATPAGALGEDAHPLGLNPAAGLPLFWGDGARDRTRFAYAVYLLCKDVEQLLAAHGIPTVAPNQPLQNLYVLVTAAASGVPRRRDGGGELRGQAGLIAAKESAGEEADSSGDGGGGAAAAVDDDGGDGGGE